MSVQLPSAGKAAETSAANEERIQFVLRLFKLFRIAAIHKWNNDATLAPQQELKEAIHSLAQAKGQITLQVYDHNVFIDKTKIRFDASSFEMIKKFYRNLVDRGIGGVTFLADVEESDLRHFMDCLVHYDRSVKKPFFKIRDKLRTLEVTRIQINTPRTLRRLEAQAAKVDSRTFVILTYAKAVQVLRNYVQNLDKPDVQLAQSSKAARVVQDLVDISYREGDRFLALATIKSDEDYYFHHSVNTAILSILIGHRIGMRKSQIGDLGFAALFHDIGKNFLPEHVLGKRGPLDEQERREVARAPMLAVEHYLGYTRFGESHFRRLVVAFEANRADDHATAEDLHLTSRIVNLARDFDALTTTRPWRGAYLPDEAMRMMWEKRGTQYDTRLLKVLMGLVGLVPLGSVVRLDTGEVGLVLQNHRDPALADRPKIKLLLDANGQETQAGVVDLTATREGDGSYLRSIAGFVDGRAAGLNTAGLLLT